MLRRSLFLTVLCSLFPLVIVANAEDFTFRKTRWAMTKEEVKQFETSTPIVDIKRMLIYEINIMGGPVNLAYFFHNDKLTSGIYDFVRPRLSHDSYIDDYKILASALNRKYGEPMVSKIDWLEEVFKNDRSKWGLAVAVGHLKFWSVWHGNKTKIKLSLTGKDYQSSLMIAYSNEPSYSNPKQETKEDDEL